MLFFSNNKLKEQSLKGNLDNYFVVFSKFNLKISLMLLYIPAFFLCG